MSLCLWLKLLSIGVFFFSSRRRHTRWTGDWSSDVCSSDLLVSDAFAELGLHLGQDLLLGELWEDDGLSQSELIARLGVEPPTMTKMLQRMERAGLLRRERAPAGGRVWRVYLTERGRALERPVREIRAEVERRLLAGL